MARSLVLIAGLPGAPLRRVAVWYEQHGRLLLPPGETPGGDYARAVYAAGGSPEACQMHDDVFSAAGLPWYTDRVPRWYDPPHPGPAEFLERFPEEADVVLADFRLCVLLPLWLPHASALVVCGTDRDRSVDRVAAQNWEICDPVPVDVRREAEKVVDRYAALLQEDGRGLPRLELSVDELSDGRYADRLATGIFHLPGFGPWPLRT